MAEYWQKSKTGQRKKEEPTSSKVYIRHKCGTIYLEYIPPGGKKKWENTRLHLTGDPESDREAETMAEQMRIIRERQIIAGQWGLQNPEDSRLTVEGYMEKLARDIPKSHHIPKALKHVQSYSKGMYITAATDQWVRGFGEYLLSLKRTMKDGSTRKLLSETSASHYLAALRHVFKVAYRDNVILKNPALYVQGITEPEPEKVWLTVKEMNRLRGCFPRKGKLSETIRRAFLFDCNIGFRISDLQESRYGHIRINEAGERQIGKLQKKTKRMVYVPLNSTAWELIEDEVIHHANELIFPELSRKKTQFADYFREWEKKAGIDHHIGWHTARHTFAVQLLIAGTDIYTVSKLLGHKSIKTTEVYLHAVDAMKREAVDKLPDLRERNFKIVG